MKSIFLTAVLTGLMLTSASSYAVYSYCGVGPDEDSFYHRASLGILELSFPYVGTLMETQVSGPVTPSLYSFFYNTLNSWHFFLNMPPGNYYWYGYSETEVIDFEYFWEIFDASFCLGAWTVVQPPYCETTEIQAGSVTTLTSNVHSYLVSAIQNGFAAVEKLGICSNTGTPTFSGSLQLEEVSQCCEDAERTDSATRASGSASFFVPSLSCTLKQIIVPQYGIVLEGSVGAGASANLGYSGISQSMCGSEATPISLSGNISGGFGGEIGVGGISTRVIGAGVQLSDSFTISASGPDVHNLELSGCIGPAEVTGWFRFLGSEVDINIVPQEWAEGTTLCL